MKKESSTNLQKYSGIAEQMVKMSLDCPEITKMILDIIYGDEGEGNGDPDKEEHNLPETEKYFQRWTKSNN